jgi:hypothetical protein
MTLLGEVNIVRAYSPMEVIKYRLIDVDSLIPPERPKPGPLGKREPGFGSRS